MDRHGGLGRRPGLHAAARVVGNPIGRLHPELLEGLVDDGDVGEVLHPVGRVPAGHDEPRRKPVEHRQRRAVHLVGDDDVRIVERARERQRLHEVRHARERRLVEPVEGHLDRALAHARRRQYVLEAAAHPLRVAHGAVAPLPAEHAGREAAAAVARALVHRGHRRRGELRPELVHRQLERAVHVPSDAQPPRREVHLRRNGEHVIPDEERLVRGDRAIEPLHRRLELRRA